MVRVKHAAYSRKRKKRVLKLTKGHYAQRHSRFAQAKRSLIKALTYAYRDRKVRKRDFRKLWIVRINAACRESGISYSRFIKGLSVANVAINRKMLADMALNAPETFRELVKISQNTAPAAPEKKTPKPRKKTEVK